MRNRLESVWVVSACAVAIVLATLVWRSWASAALPAPPLPRPPEKLRQFEFAVRELFFEGLAGNERALNDAMRLCEETLAKHPEHPEALVWHGAGLYFLAGREFQRGDVQKGQEMRARGLREMEEAVRLAPDDIAVLIPRAAALLPAVEHIRARSPEAARRAAETAVRDYERVMALQAGYSSTTSEHARGELLGGLAQGWRSLDDDTQARHYLKRMSDELPGSAYAAKAEFLLSKKPLPRDLGIMCLGCHY
jgi:hypothetical protein